jgi:molybdopterin-guanine dinucleotide biosynthesis protein A
VKLPPPLLGLVLIGGESRRMGTDKAALTYHEEPQWLHSARLLHQQCAEVYLSEKTDSQRGAEAGFPSLPDRFDVGGPLNGILSALDARPDAAWLVLACDLPGFDAAELEHLVRHRSPAHCATALCDPDSGYPEPLAAIWEPLSRVCIDSTLARGKNPGPSAILLDHNCKTISPLRREALHNINTPAERMAHQTAPSAAAEITVTVCYFASLRDDTGTSEEAITTRSQTPAALFAELQTRHSFRHAQNELRVAINDTFRPWDAPLKSGDKLVFIPPVSGG